MAKTVELSAFYVNELAKLRSEIAALQEREKKLSGDLKESMLDDELEEYAPKDSPFKLVCQTSQRTSVSWKDEWKTLAKLKFGKKWKKEEERVIEEAGTTDVVSLFLKPNERYEAE